MIKLTDKEFIDLQIKAVKYDQAKKDCERLALHTAAFEAKNKALKRAIEALEKMIEALEAAQ